MRRPSVADDGTSAAAPPAAPLSARQQQIVDLLASEGFLSVRRLTDVLSVSEMTVRRDVRGLATRGLVRLVHGGVAPTHGTLRTPGFVHRAAVEAEAKQRIAAAGLAFVGAGETVAIDAGTTTFALAERLGETAVSAVITNSIPVIQLFLGRPEQRLVVLGGDVIPESQAMVGSLAVAATAQLRASTLFLGSAAVDARGLYVETDAERPTKLALMEAADTVVLLCDASKFTVSAPVRLCAFDDVDVLVTDVEPPPAVRAAAEGAGTRVVVAGRGTPQGHTRE